ncbi:hypothetical protein A2U01_0007537, partial [Trifolium medium]|nr:hypothetical protein [Trifolium medium]
VPEHAQQMVVDEGGKFEEVTVWEAPREGLSRRVCRRARVRNKKDRGQNMWTQRHGAEASVKGY